jgi:hypothetical protein
MNEAEEEEEEEDDVSLLFHTTAHSFNPFKENCDWYVCFFSLFSKIIYKFTKHNSFPIIYFCNIALVQVRP